MSFVASHRAPVAGLPTWDQPDASRPSGPPLPGGLDVQVTEWWGDWAHVACSNGWTAWVDGRALRPMAAPAPAPVQQPAPMPAMPAQPAPAAYRPANNIAPVAQRAGGKTSMMIGTVPVTIPLVAGAVALISAFFPWFKVKGLGSDSSMDLTAKYLFTYDVKSNDGIKLGWLVIIAAAVVIWLSIKPISRVGRRIAGSALAAMPMLYLAQIQRYLSEIKKQTGAAPGLFSVLGLGVFICLIAGIAVGVGKVPGER